VPTTYPALRETEARTFVVARTPTEGLHPQPDDLAYWNIRGRIEDLNWLGSLLAPHGDLVDSEWLWRTPAVDETLSTAWASAAFVFENCAFVTQDRCSLREQLAVQVSQLSATFAETYSICEAIPNLPSEVLEFLLGHQLFPDFSAYVRLARRFFPSAESLSATYETDPEDEATPWVALELRCTGAVDNILKQYDDFIAQTLRVIPAESRSYFRLSLDIV